MKNELDAKLAWEPEPGIETMAITMPSNSKDFRGKGNRFFSFFFSILETRNGKMSSPGLYRELGLPSRKELPVLVQNSRTIPRWNYIGIASSNSNKTRVLLKPDLENVLKPFPNLPRNPSVLDKRRQNDDIVSEIRGVFTVCELVFQLKFSSKKGGGNEMQGCYLIKQSRKVTRFDLRSARSEYREFLRRLGNRDGGTKRLEILA